MHAFSIKVNCYIVLQLNNKCETFVHAHSLQATLVFLDLGLAAGASFGYKFGQMFTLCFHTHSLIIASVIHPLRHVTAAGWVVRLMIGQEKKPRLTLQVINTHVIPTIHSEAFFFKQNVFILR